MALAELLLPAFSAFIQRGLTPDFFHDPWLLPGICAVALSVGLLSAVYPALVLSSFHPAAVLKGDRVAGRRLSWPRSIPAGFRDSTNGEDRARSGHSRASAFWTSKINELADAIAIAKCSTT